MILTALLTAITLAGICALVYAWVVRPKQETSNPSFTDIQVKPIKGAEGWSSVSFKLNDRNYRLDMEDEFAKELETRLS